MRPAANWESVIGLELHVQLATHSKIFSPAPTAYGARPNSQVDWVDAGLPGTLPVLNRSAVEMAVKFGLAVDAEITDRSIFARKNYFYPDLPKGYQISQYDRPIVSGGHFEIDTDEGTSKRIRLIRAHLEEDAGKSVHEGFRGKTGIDLNRAGVPLLEVVTAPDLRSPREAGLAMRKLHTLVRYLGICDGNLAEGSFRCDANVSIRPAGSETFGTRVELKNINSFRFVERAIEFEIHRQIHRRVSGEDVVQETRLYDPDKNETRSMRGKEEAEDYRYFPDPDLLPIPIDTTILESARRSMPELPDARKQRLIDLGVARADAVTLAGEPALGDYFDQVRAHVEADPQITANWVLVELVGGLKKRDLGVEASPVSPQDLAGLLARIDDGTISGKIAKQVFEAMLAGEGDADAIIQARGLTQITDADALTRQVAEVLERSETQIEQYLSGQDKVFNYFVGQVMAATRGRANPDAVRELLIEELDKRKS
ncbi:MAG: Asp-tRNA(Asn)/Glu-tRNA(Gln) amidotransferase subunit GatB [Xanthomonadales bacterium]|nr:Asp-tRNA(Asn)/Glu-tRNA(Gln) amidotransferase subunit GatB [Xanthomonadales bacterium]